MTLINCSRSNTAAYSSDGRSWSLTSGRRWRARSAIVLVNKETMPRVLQITLAERESAERVSVEQASATKKHSDQCRLQSSQQHSPAPALQQTARY
jgi:hypothetical protein